MFSTDTVSEGNRIYVNCLKLQITEIQILVLCAEIQKIKVKFKSSLIDDAHSLFFIAFLADELWLPVSAIR